MSNSKGLPPKARYTSKLTFPGDIYRGNTDHWSIARVKGEARVALERERARARRQSTPGCSAAACTCWRGGAGGPAGQWPFPALVLQGLGGELPGELSRGSHRYYNKSRLDWPTNRWRKDAQEGYEFWFQSDMTLGLSRRPRMDRNQMAL